MASPWPTQIGWTSTLVLALVLVRVDDLAPTASVEKVLAEFGYRLGGIPIFAGALIDVLAVVRLTDVTEIVLPGCKAVIVIELLLLVATEVESTEMFSELEGVGLSAVELLLGVTIDVTTATVQLLVLCALSNGKEFRSGCAIGSDFSVLELNCFLSVLAANSVLGELELTGSSLLSVPSGLVVSEVRKLTLLSARVSRAVELGVAVVGLTLTDVVADVDSSIVLVLLS